MPQLFSLSSDLFSLTWNEIAAYLESQVRPDITMSTLDHMIIEHNDSSNGSFLTLGQKHLCQHQMAHEQFPPPRLHPWSVIGGLP